MRRFLTSIVLAVMLSSTVFSAERYYDFEHLRTTDGLPSNTIYRTIQDRHGFIWIGTRDGLCRYDGETFVRLSEITTEHDHTGLVLDIAEDESGRIWFTSSNGAGFYDPMTDESKNLGMLGGSVCWDIESDGRGNVWMASDKVYRYDTATSSTQTYSFDSGSPYKLAMDSLGTLWVLMRSGEVYTYDRLKNDFTIQRPSENIKLIEAAESGRLIVATSNDDVYLLDCISLNTKLIFKSQGKLKIRCLCENSPGEFWIGTDNGLYIRRENDDYTGEAFHDEAIPSSLSANLINSLDRDLSGNMWVGTYYTGLNIWKNKDEGMTSYFKNPSQSTIQGKIVRSVCPDSNGLIWFCTEDGWFGNLNSKTNTTVNYQMGDNVNLHDVIVDNDIIWLCSYGNGVYVINPATGKTRKHYKIQNNFISSGIKTARNEILAGTREGIYKYNGAKDCFELIEGTENDHIHSLFQDSRGTIWVGTYGNGLYCMDADLRIISRHGGYGCDCGLSSRYITSFFEDSRKRIWITTEGGGVCISDPMPDISNIRFSSITTKNGLSSNVTCAVAEDNDATIWVSTINGIMSISGDELIVTGHLNAGNKISGYQYSYGAVCTGSSGMLYFGNSDGMISFLPSLIKNRNTQWGLLLTAIEARNSEGSIPLKNEGHSAMTSTDITVRHKDASAIFISFAVPEFSTRNMIYRYSLSKGKRVSFSGTTNDNNVLLTGLRPGKYTFKVSTVGNNPQSASFNMTIKPHVLLGRTAYVIYLILAFLVFAVLLQLFEHRRRAERARQYAKLVNNKEKEIYNAKINFFTNITHEIRTPLSLIKMPLDKIMSSGMYTAESEKDLRTIQANTDRLLSLTNQLLDMRKMESNELKMSFIKENLSSIVRKAIGLFEQMASEQHIKVNIDIPEAPLEIMCAKDSVLTIVTNLLSNAVKYGKETINIIVGKKDDDTAFVRIESDGEMIPGAEKEKIFQIFFQRDAAIKAGQGTGLGLPYARNLAIMHNGRLFLDDNVTDMNSFVLELPVHQRDEVQISLPPPTHKSEGKDTHDYDITRHTVLVVEDSEEMREYVAEELSAEYNIRTASNGADALDIIRNDKIDLVVSDIMMPVMDGCELCNTIKQDSDLSHIPIILLTAVVGTEKRIETLEVGADGYIEKPFTMELLKSNIVNLFKNKEISYRQFMNKPLTHYSSVTVSKVDQEYMDKVHDFIMKHIAETDLNIENLTIQLGTSKSSLYRKLKANTGLSINEYIRLCRLKQAAELLSSQKYKINEVAFMTGFSSPSYFATCFQKQFDITPSEFVKNLGQ